MNRGVIAGLTMLAALALSGCAAGERGPTFEELCTDAGGVVISDSTTKLMTGVVTGTVVAGNGSVGVGTGVVTSPVRFDMSLCVVDGDVTDMELR
jgi:hypothetical protein